MEGQKGREIKLGKQNKKPLLRPILGNPWLSLANEEVAAWHNTGGSCPHTNT